MKEQEWPASPARSEEPGLPNGPASHGTAPVGLLTITFPSFMDEEAVAHLSKHAQAACKDLNLKAIVLPDNMKASVQYDLSPLIAAIQAQSQAINRLADSNQGLIRAMAEDAGMNGDDEPKGYLNARS